MNEKPEKKKKSKLRKVIGYVLTGIVVCLFALVAIGQVIGLVSKDKNNGQSLAFGKFGNFIVLTDSMEPEYDKNNAIITYKQSPDTIYQMYLENLEYNRPIQEEYAKKISTVTSTDEKITLIEEMEKKEKHIDITFMDNYSGYASIKPSKGTSDPILENLDSPVQVSSGEMSSPIMTHRLREMRIDETKKEGEGRYIFITSGTNINGYYASFGQYQAFTENQFLGEVILNSPALGSFFRFVTSVWGLLILLLIPALYLIITSIIDIVKALKEKDETEPVPANTALKDLPPEEIERLKQEMLEDMMNKKQDDGHDQ